jgi:ATP-binding cassette subfamily C protein CydC
VLISPVLAWVVVMLLALNLLLTELTRRRGQVDSQQRMQALPDLRRHSIEMLEGLADLIAFDQLDAVRQAWSTHSERAITADTRLARLDATAQAGVTALGFIGVWLGLVVGIGLYAEGHITGPVLGLLVLALLGLGEVWQPLPGAWRKLEQCRSAYHRIRQLTDRQPELSVAPSPHTQLPERANLVIDRVSHRYQDQAHDKNPWVLQDFSLTLAPGERVVVTGPSGCGKTTLAQLIMRLMDPISGRITYGGDDLKNIDPETWRSHVAVLSQHTLLFRDTLANNLRLAQPQASDEALVSVLHQAGLGPLLETLPEGLETWIDEAGSNFSGGEARRLALARLMLTDAPMVILDEPMTGLDADTAVALSATLDDWLGQRSVLIISHDPSHLPRHDRCIALTAASAVQ